MTSLKIDRILSYLALASLFSLALFSFTSTALSSTIHIFVMPAGLYFFYQALRNRQDFYSISQLGLWGVIIFGAISVLAAPDMVNKLAGVAKLRYFLVGILSIYAYRQIVGKQLLDDSKIRLLLNIFMIAVSIATISGIIGLFTGYNPLRFRAASDEWRATGMYGMAITYGYGIQFVCILFCGLLLYRHRLQQFFNSKILVIATVIALAGLYYSYTRGAIIGFLIALPFLFYRKSKKAFVAVMITGILIISLAVAAIATGKAGGGRLFQSLTSDSNMIRISQYRAAWHGFLENPLTGLGYRNFEPHSVPLKTKYNLGFLDFSGHAHNNIMEILAGTGIFGFISVMVFILFWFIESFRRRDEVGLIMPAIVVAFFISGLLQNTMMDAENMYVLMALYALSQVKLRKDKVA